MDSTPPYPIGPGKRVLAAIVFTDVVSFSRRMHREEVPTLELLEHDFGIMRKLAAKHEGTVLKTTGDGLLLYFTSAVQAVGYALVLQRQFARRARAHPTAPNLSHRVGIHLGDVFTKDDDVMGDGVNTAARLQAEADPGGICLSQTVYDVVKNKLELQVVRVPPRGPKSIAEAVTIYRVVLEAGTLQPVPAPPPAVPAPATPAPAPGPRVAPPRFAGFILVAVLLASAGVMLWRWQQGHREELERSRAAQAELDALLVAKSKEVIGPDRPERERTAEASAAPAAGQPRGDRQDELRAWAGSVLSRYTRDRPLRLRELSGALAGDTKLFVDQGRLHFAEGGAVRPRPLTGLKADVMGAVIVSLLLDAPSVPPDLFAAAQDFAQAHNLAEMQATLRDQAAKPRTTP